MLVLSLFPGMPLAMGRAVAQAVKAALKPDERRS
jgi:hypothetical protein